MNHIDPVDVFNADFHSKADDDLFEIIGKSVDGKNSTAIMATLAFLLADVMVSTMDEEEACHFSKAVGGYIHSAVHVIARNRTVGGSKKHS